MMQLNPFEDLGYYAFNYKEAAEMLFSQWEGRPEQDAFLMPLLALYRQAFELELKSLALAIASHQVRLGGDPEKYSRSAMESTIGQKGFGHSIERSKTWINEELKLLGFAGEACTPKLDEIATMIHNLDPKGTDFRYPAKIADSISINPTGLLEDLRDAFKELQGLHALIEAHLEAVPGIKDLV